MKLPQKFLTLLAFCVISTATFSISSCSEKQLILSIETTEQTYYSYDVYSPKKQKVYYIKDKNSITLDITLTTCEQLVYPSPAKRGDSFSIEASPYEYISKSDRVQYDIVKKSSLAPDEEQSDFLENDIGKDWLAFEDGFIRQQSVLDPNFYYTYSNTLNAQLYMNVDYELTEQKTIKLKEKENTYQITYYTYIYDQSTPIFEKHVVEVPISQVTLIEYE